MESESSWEVWPSNVSTVAASEHRDYSHRWQTCQTFVSRKHSHHSSSPMSAWTTLDRLVVHRDAEVKTYICLFTCLVTRAIHLEFAEDLSRQVFDSNPTLHRSTWPTAVVPVRQRIQLPGSKKADQKKTTDVRPRLHQRSATEPVCRMEAQPSFCSSLMWGVGETRSVCLLLNLDSAKLTPDVFATIVSEAEFLVNSHPLTHVRSNHEDDNPLTPNHFLLGRPFCNVPGAVFNETLTLKSSVWTHVKQRLEQIWKRLLTEFVPSLNKRQKWTSHEAALELDDVVWLLEELTPRGIWPLGRVTRTFTGRGRSKLKPL